MSGSSPVWAPVRRARALYIVGAGHSGSSITDVLLGMHPAVVSTGETHRLSITPDVRECACGMTVADCPFWTEVLEHLKLAHPELNLASWGDFPVSAFAGPATTLRRRLDMSIARGFLALMPDAPIRILASISPALRRELAAAEKSWLLFDVLCDRWSADVIVDSTKTPSRLRALRLLRPDDLYVLHLVRDGRAVAGSEIRRDGASPRDAARNWARANRYAELVLRNVPRTHQRRLRYEDLCASPESTIRHLFSWLGLARPKTLEMPAAGAVHSIPGNPKLLSGLGGIRLDDRWRTQLSDSETSDIESVARESLARYGYR